MAARKVAAAARTAPAAPARKERPRKRLRAGEREAAILAAAAEFFAEVGLEGRTRDLARRMGVTQALLYRYFRSKEELLDRLFAARSAAQGNSNESALADETRPLEERLLRFYGNMVERANRTSTRLWVMGNMAGRGLARRRSFTLTERVFKPIIAALRRDAALPGFDQKPMLRGERELAMTLHGGIVFLSIRKFVYEMPLPENRRDLAELQVRTFLAGAPVTLLRLHGEPDNTSLSVPMIVPGKKVRR